ncbi:HWE histidine kinase domain-containing protein [Roseobacteraceae bacterium NS-SX3]
MTDGQTTPASGAPQPGQTDLTTCDREPIHLLGRIQSLGCLIAVNSDWMVSHASENLEAFAGVPAREAVGEPLQSLLEEQSIHDIRNRLQFLHDGEGNERIRSAVFRNGGAPLGVTVHVSGDHIVLEMEPAAEAEEFDGDVSTVRSLMTRLSQTEDLDRFFKDAAKYLRALTGMDRVMVYRFLPDGCGEVIAEAKAAEMEPFLHLRYPASDIPKQARALYLRNPIRIITDSADAGVPVFPATSPDGAILDLSQSVLRSVSPIHLEYLRNMGVAASMSVSIIVGGKLWGLLACHCQTPLALSPSKRGAAELFGQIFSLLLAGKLSAEDARTEREVRALTTRFTSSMSMTGAPMQQIVPMLREFAEFVSADGFGLVLDGAVHLEGSAPTQEEFGQIVKFLNRASANSVFSSHKLASAMPEAEHFAAQAAGLLAVPVSRSPRDYIVFFRREVVKSVFWAGNPEKPVTAGPNGSRLTPRGSFAAWRELVKGESEHWSGTSLAAAAQLRLTLLEIVLRLTGEAEKERAAAQERQELLIAELNHRVRNILGLVKGLISQSKSSSRSAAEYMEVLDSRIHALARAHDQITGENWSASSFVRLVQTEVESYLQQQKQRVSFAGDDFLLAPSAFTAVALVMHEMVTNAAKYGALSDNGGKVFISVQPTPSGGREITWQERGGPPVQPPDRRGFGSTIVERSIPHELKGKARISYKLAGVEAEFEIPSAYVTPSSGAAATPDAARQPAPNRSKLPASVLIVEDNLVIAMGAEAMFEDLGASRIVLASSADQAKAELEDQAFDFALLDINLGDHTSLELAQEMQANGQAFAFASGYGEHAEVPLALQEVPRLSKPYGKDMILEALKACLEA